MSGSRARLASAVRRAAVVPQGHPLPPDAIRRLETVAADHGVELTGSDLDVDLAVALGGDGTMLRALHRFLGTSVPVLGVNFGRVGFLTSVPGSELEAGLARAFLGDCRVVELATISACVDGEPRDAVNDVVVTSSQPGRLIELSASLGVEDLGATSCDGLICCTPSGSTAYNLSNGGPVLMRGLDAMAITYVAPHSLHARPLVVEPGLGLTVTNRTADVPATVVLDGQTIGQLPHGQSLTVDVGAEKALLALLPEVTFFSRYREVFLAP
jgi:NAD+ kinase